MISYPLADSFVFENNFKPFDPPISLPDFLGVNKVLAPYGLCGGMSSAAYDFRLERVSNPQAPNIRKYLTVPKTGTRLHRYLIRRSLDTFGTSGMMIGIVGEWSMLPDDTPAGIRKLTLDGLPNLIKKLDESQCVVMTLIYEHATNLKDLSSKIWLNHQVLAYRYRQTNQETYGSASMTVTSPAGMT